MASKDKSDRIISLVRGAIYVDVVARISGKIKEFRFIKDYNDREIRDMVLDTKTPPLLDETKESENTDPQLQSAPTVPDPPPTPKARASRQDMVAALKAAGITNIPVNNRNALEKAYCELLQGGDK